MRFAPGLLAAALVLAALDGCRPAPTTPPAEVVESVAERGPLRFTAQARPRQPWLGDTVELCLHLHAPEDYVVQLPTADDLREWGVRAVHAPEPQPAPGGGLDWRRTFTLESFTSGPREIPPLVARYARREPGGTSQPALENELVTGTLRIEVRSALTTQDSVTKPREITGPVLPERTWGEIARTGLLAAAIAALLAGAALGAWRLWRRRRPAPPPVPAEIEALQALAELGREDWLGTGRAREFYYRLSEIVRAYIERKFALAAPEMTTEEFLLALTLDRAALPYDPDKLRSFLAACDIVKYAAYAPRREDADQALASARIFVHETAAAAERVARTAAAPPAPAAPEPAA